MHRDRLLRLQEVCSIVGLSRSTIYALCARGRFPPRILLGQRAVAWWESEIDAWIAARPRASAGSANPEQSKKDTGSLPEEGAVK